MLAAALRLPLLVILMAVFAVTMLIPAAHGAVVQDLFVARVFLYSAMVLGFFAVLMGLTLGGRQGSSDARHHLLGLVGVYVILPLMLAVPLHQALGNTSFLNAYTEMVSSLTTTGATLFDDPARLPNSVHLWRALVGWLGGLIIWIGAIAILAPMSLGGFEVRGLGAGLSTGFGQITKVADMSSRIRTYALRLTPIYAGLSLALWVGLIIAGDSAFVALCHALSTMATSGISPVGGLSGGGAGVAGEMFIAIFLIFAISRGAFVREGRLGEAASFVKDPEVRLAFALIALVTGFLFLRHWVGAYEVDDELDLIGGLNALWGTAFTLVNFLTTAGFESESWATARNWSGLQTPGLVLMGMAMIGGGVATTAGGAKLMRVYALYKHSLREMEKLVHPSSVGGAGGEARHIRSRGAYLSWVFFMLMAISIAGFMLAFSLTGQSFENSVVLTISAITTTGPLAALAAGEPISYAHLSSPAKLILSTAMVVGRLETLAFVALLNPDIWRR